MITQAKTEKKKNQPHIYWRNKPRVKGIYQEAALKGPETARILISASKMTKIQPDLQK